MAEHTPQTYANHTRLDPLYHFLLSPLAIAGIVCGVIAVVHHHSLASATLLVLAVGLFFNVLLTRTYALRVQDRVIRLEERARLALLVPEAFRPRIPELTVPQLLALRFASDAELPALAARALDEGLTRKQIKLAIQNWRADYFRV